MKLVLHGMKQRQSVFKTLLKFIDGWALGSSVLLIKLLQSARKLIDLTTVCFLFFLRRLSQSDEL